jgi:RNA polymerase sigma factor (TIGR02999 family)
MSNTQPIPPSIDPHGQDGPQAPDGRGGGNARQSTGTRDHHPATVHHVTVLLQAAAAGDARASSELLPLVYDELRRLADSNMRREADRGAGHTLQPTALVHEAYLRLVGDVSPSAQGPNVQGWNGRGHFFGAAAQAMRRILIERARARNAQKRGGGAARVELRDDAVATTAGGVELDDAKADEIIALDRALDRLSALDERSARVVMLRYFAGLTVEQTAAAMDLSPATVKKCWVFARAWLNREIGSSTTP